jgi:hypothetical protein
MKYGIAKELGKSQVIDLDPNRFKGAHRAAKAYKARDKDHDGTVHIAIGHNMQKARVLWKRIQAGALDAHAIAAVKKEYSREFAIIAKESHV